MNFCAIDVQSISYFFCSTRLLLLYPVEKDWYKDRFKLEVIKYDILKKTVYSLLVNVRLYYIMLPILIYFKIAIIGPVDISILSIFMKTNHLTTRGLFEYLFQCKVVVNSLKSSN